MNNPSRIVPNRPPGLLGESSSVPPPLGARTIRETTEQGLRDNRPDAGPGFALFVDKLALRLDQGRREYGDASFTREPKELIGELQQEALDLAGWGYILFCRLDAMREALNVCAETLPARAREGGQDG